MYLAQFNIARIKYPLSDPRMKEFVDNIDFIHKIAERVGGIVHRVKDSSGNATSMSVFNDSTLVPNLTIWQTPEQLQKFVYKTVHSRFLARKDEWFLPIEGPKNCLWWCAETYKPLDMYDGELRLSYMKEYGNSDYAFDFTYLQNRFARIA